MIDIIFRYKNVCAFIIGIIIDCIVGDPEYLPHPVRAIGSLVSSLEKLLLKKGDRAFIQRIKGGLLAVTVCTICTLSTFLLFFIFFHISVWLDLFVRGIFCAWCLAAKNLCDEAKSVYMALKERNLQKAQKRLSRIVGRDTDVLKEEGIIRACVETVAENTTDGVIAPLFYMVLGGPVLGMLYKAINTMDSMIGYKNERYRYFGTVAAHLDDVFGFIPARLAGVSMIIASFFVRLDWKNATRIFLRDRRAHESPNAAFTESACSGALRIQLGGKAFYSGIEEEHPLLGDNLKSPCREDILKSCTLMYAASAVCFLYLMPIAILLQSHL